MTHTHQDLVKRILIPCLIGNALEFYDFTLCGVFLVILGETFFPASDAFSSMLFGVFAFSAAFWTRPLGAVLFGYIGDKYGRKNALTISVLMMGIPTFIIASLPSYKEIGIIAPCVLVACRLVQGLCTGGEYNGAAIFALEHIGVRRGLISGLISASCVIGAISATLVAYFITHYLPYESSWRIAFYLGALVSVIGYFLRKYSMETKDFNNRHAITSLPIVEVVRKYPKQFLLAIASGAFNGILSYTLFGFLNVYMTMYVGIQSSVSLYFNIFGLLAFMISCPIFGMISDIISPYRSMILAAFVAIAGSWSGFYLLQTGSHIGIILGQILIGIGVGSFVGPSHAFLQQQFHSAIRYTGIASGFSLGMAITGGSTAIIMSYLLQSTGEMFAPCVYITLAAVLWLVVLGECAKGKYHIG